MSTTAVFAELLVGGLQTLTWMTLITLTVFGPVDPGILTNTPLLSTFFIIATCYGLGVIFDRVWDIVLDETGLNSWIGRMAKSRAVATTEDVFGKFRRNIFGKDAKTAADFANYNRSRLRVARCSVFNFGLITISSLVFVSVHYGGPATKIFAFLAMAGLLVTVASAVAFYDLRKSYYRALRMLSPPESAELNETA
jgi:hypothetical protein